MTVAWHVRKSRKKISVIGQHIDDTFHGRCKYWV